MTDYTTFKVPVGSAEVLAKNTTNVIDAGFQVITVDVDSSTQNLAQSDTVQLVDVPSGTFVWKVWSQCVTAEGDTLTIDVGTTGGDVDRYVDGVNGNSATTTPVIGAGTDIAAGVYYQTGGVISALYNNASTAAKMRFIFLVSNVNYVL